MIGLPLIGGICKLIFLPHIELIEAKFIEFFGNIFLQRFYMRRKYFQGDIKNFFFK